MYLFCVLRSFSAVTCTFLDFHGIFFIPLPVCSVQVFIYSTLEISLFLSKRKLVTVYQQTHTLMFNVQCKLVLGSVIILDILHLPQSGIGTTKDVLFMCDLIRANAQPTFFLTSGMIDWKKLAVVSTFSVTFQRLCAKITYLPEVGGLLSCESNKHKAQKAARAER